MNRKQRNFGLNDSKYNQKQKKILKKCLKNAYSLGKPKKIESLSKNWHVYADTDCSYIEYMIVKTDNIESFIENEVRLPYINSLYDCTGQHFTQFIHYTQNCKDNSWNIIHHIGIDY